MQESGLPGEHAKSDSPTAFGFFHQVNGGVSVCCAVSNGMRITKPKRGISAINLVSETKTPLSLTNLQMVCNFYFQTKRRG